MKFTAHMLIVLLTAVIALAHDEPVTVGSGTQFYPRPALGRPFGTEPLRYQILALADELALAPGTRITAIAFDGAVFAREPITFKDVEIVLAPTDAATLEPDFAANTGTGATRVLHRPELVLDQFERGWLTLTFEQPFTYAGGNLVIEFRHAGGNGVFRTTRWAHPPGRTLDSVGLHGTVSGPESERGILRDYMNALRLLVE